MKWEQLGDIPTVLLDECGSSHEYINQQIRSPNQVNMDQTHNHPATSGLVDLERCLQHVASSCSDEASLKKWATKTDARQRERRNVKKKKKKKPRERNLPRKSRRGLYDRRWRRINWLQRCLFLFLFHVSRPPSPRQKDLFSLAIGPNSRLASGARERGREGGDIQDSIDPTSL